MSGAWRIGWRGVSCMLALLVSSPVLAASTGSVSGHLVAADGSPLQGVRVTVTGDPLPAGRATESRGEGAFALPRRPPGSFRIAAVVDGSGRAERDIVVAVDRDTQVELLLAPASG